MRTLLSVSLVVALTAIGTAAEPTADVVHKQALGKWVAAFNEEGNSYRLVKDIGQETETYSIFENDELVQQWVVKIKIEIVNGICNFTYWDGRLTVGEDKGETIFEKPRSYIFKIHDDKWYEALAMVVTDREEPVLRVYQRVE